MKYRTGDRVQFFLRIAGLEEVVNGTVISDNGPILTVLYDDNDIMIERDDLVEDWNYGFSEETEEKFISWYGED